MTTSPCSATAARPPPDDFPAAARRAARLLRATASRPTIRSRRLAACPGGPSARAVAAGLLDAERALGRPSSACPTRSPTSSTRRAPHRRAYRERFAARERLAAPRLAVAVWAIVRRHRGGGPAAGGEQPDGLPLLRRGRLIPVPPPEKALRFLASEGRPRAPRRRPARDLGTPATVRAGPRDAGAEYGAEEVDRGHDHPRPRGPPALLRAARRGVRPRGRGAGAADGAGPA